MPSLSTAESIVCGSGTILVGSSSAELEALCGKPSKVNRAADFAGADVRPGIRDGLRGSVDQIDISPIATAFNKLSGSEKQDFLERILILDCSPRIGDIHRVHNAFDDRVSISIHVYGADIGVVPRSIYGLDGSRQPFVSGYSPI